MIFFKYLNITIAHIVKLLILTALFAHFNIANAQPVTLKIEDMADGIYNWQGIESDLPGFGSEGPVTIDWNPDEDFFTELLYYDSGYSERAGAFCWYQLDCSLELSVSSGEDKITLDSFFLGSYEIDGDFYDYTVIDLETDAIIFSGSPWIDSSNGAIVNVNASSNVGFRILFGVDGVDGGINDISYSYSKILPTPIPTAFLLFVSGMIGLIKFGRIKT